MSKNVTTPEKEAQDEAAQLVSGEKSVDSGVMVNDQLSSTLELVARLEQNLREDVYNQAFS